MDTQNNKNKKPQSLSQKARNGILGGLICTTALCALTYLIYDKLFEYPIGKFFTYSVGFFTFIILMVTVSCYFDLKEAKHIEKLEEDSRQEAKEFSEIDPDKRALRAEKLFKINQKELMRYYDMNIAQTKFLSILGIGMIISGMAIVIMSCFAYISLDSDKLLLIVGNVSGVVVDFIGAVFIKMYTQNLEAAVKFHAKFAESNNLLLANSIANKIENTDLREKTLASISKEIIGIGHNINDNGD